MEEVTLRTLSVPYVRGLYKVETRRGKRPFFILVTKEGYKLNDISYHLRHRERTDSYLSLLPKDLLCKIDEYGTIDSICTYTTNWRSVYYAFRPMSEYIFNISLLAECKYE
jgi:hypothetical protein